MKRAPIYLFLCVICMVMSFYACDEDVNFPIEVIESPFYLKLNQQGQLFDEAHEASGTQAQSDIVIPNICDWLYRDCNIDNDIDTFYFAASIGNDVLGTFNFVITNFPYASDVILNRTTDSLAFLLDQLPKQNGNLVDIAVGNFEEGITSGNVFIGKENYEYGYAFPQLAEFKIIEIKDEVMYGEPVVAITFEFEYTIATKDSIKIQLSNGKGCLPFGLHGNL